MQLVLYISLPDYYQCSLATICASLCIILCSSCIALHLLCPALLPCGVQGGQEPGERFVLLDRFYWTV